MQPRLNFYTAGPDVIKAMIGVENQINKSALDILLK